MPRWKNQGDLAESKKIAREEIRLEHEMRNKSSEIIDKYQAKIDALREKRFALTEKNT